MLCIKRPPPPQDSIANSRENRAKRTLTGFPPPPALIPPASRNPAQWAASLNLNTSDVQPSNIPSAQPHHQKPGQQASSDFSLLESPSLQPINLQRPISPIRTSSQFQPQQPAASSLLLLRFSERPMAKNENDVTMSKVIDQILIPRDLEDNPKCSDNGVKSRKRYSEMMRFRHLKLVSRVERWRRYIPYKEKDEELRRERKAKKDDLDPAWRDKELRQFLRDTKKRRDRKNLTDYVNGRVEGVSRGRLMCWPILIPISELYTWSRKDLNSLMWVEEPGSELEVDDVSEV
ncbi:MAG: hypothetical protein Q9221_004545 [Calogaya cf. arnoldii]